MLTLARPHLCEQVIKRSRFIGHAARAKDPDSAQRWIRSVGRQDANHNCWAWRTGGRYRFSDDGEPGGTAGRPILQAIDGEGLDCVAVVVTRYFGGIKLGTGGLVRAYGRTARDCLRGATQLEIRPRAEISVRLPLTCIGLVQVLLDRFDATRDQETYDADGVRIDLTMDAQRVGELEAALIEATSGRARVARSP